MDGERAKPFKSVFSKTQFECPTCTPFGMFGYVPIDVAIEGALIGKKPKTRQQLEAQAWLEDFMR